MKEKYYVGTVITRAQSSKTSEKSYHLQRNVFVGPCRFEYQVFFSVLFNHVRHLIALFDQLLLFVDTYAVLYGMY